MLHTLGRGLGCGQRLPRREGLWGAHLSSSPTTPSPGKAGGKKGKGGERSFRRALRVARPGEVGLAVSRNDPSVLRAGPSWSRLENPLERPGALPAAWENVFPELKGVISSLPSHSGCGLRCPGLQAGGWGPREESSAAPGLACKASTWSRRQSWQKTAAILQDNRTGRALCWGGNQRRLPGGGNSRGPSRN